MIIATYLVVLLATLFGCEAHYADWNAWSACSSLCGSGTTTRERLYIPRNNDSCYSAIEQKKSCTGSCLENRVGSFNNSSDLDNLVESGECTASSQLLNAFHCNNAIDGNTNTDFYNKSCMHTKKDDKPWLRIDLKSIKLVHKVVVYNRYDCCTIRLNNLEVTVGNSENGTGNKVCGFKKDMFNVEKETFQCCKTYGRYIHLKIPGPQFLSVCEVEVLGVSPKNLAKGKIASQSSTYHSASLAVDGNFNTFSETNYYKSSWWRVDLRSEAEVVKVVLWSYDSYGSYISNAIVTVGNNYNSAMTECGKAEDKNSGNSVLYGYRHYNIACDRIIKGRYVKVTYNNHYYSYLVIREAEVFAYQF